MFQVILSAVLFAIFSFMPAIASWAASEEEVEFARLHLNVQPVKGWKKEAISEGIFSGCIGYLNEAEKIGVMGCPVPGGNEFKESMTEFKELMEESNKKGSGVVAGKGYLSRRYDGIAYTLYVPLKNGKGGAFFEILGEDGDLDNEKYFVPIMKNGVQLFAFDPELMRRAEPMLRAFSDFAIPIQFPPLSPFIPYNQEERLQQYSARRNWKLDPASGWSGRLQKSRSLCRISFTRSYNDDYKVMRISQERRRDCPPILHDW